MSEIAAGEPAGPTDQPAGPTDLPVQTPELPVRPSKLLVQVSKLLVQPLELRRLFTTFGYLVAKQGATAVLGLAYWAVATHLFSAQDVGLAAAASSAAFFLAAIGALGIPLLLLAEIGSLPPAVRRVTFSTGIYDVTSSPSQGVAPRRPQRPHGETGAGNAGNGRHDAGTSPSGRQGENARLPAPSDAVGSAPGRP